MKLKHTLPLAVAGILSLGTIPAQAYVMASSVVKMSNFTITGSNGNQLDTSDFSSLTFTSSADYSGSLNGASFSDNAPPPPAPIDFPANCVGGGCAALGLSDNVFPKLSAAPVGDYAAADQLEEGAPITGLDNFSSPANVMNASYAALKDSPGTGSSNSNNNLNSSFIFQLNQDTGITFDFDVDAWLQAAITSEEGFPGFATASYDVNFTITDLSTGEDIFNFAPDLFGTGTKTISLNAPLPTDVELTRDTGGPIHFSATTDPLSAGTLYQLSARINTNVDVARVPEPSILALLGIGLFGLTMSRRRQQNLAI